MRRSIKEVSDADVSDAEVALLLFAAAAAATAGGGEGVDDCDCDGVVERVRRWRRDVKADATDSKAALPRC